MKVLETYLLYRLKRAQCPEGNRIRDPDLGSPDSKVYAAFDRCATLTAAANAAAATRN